jgi:hypothetical protein
MTLDHELSVEPTAPAGHASSLAGLVIVRGAGAPLVQRRLPRRSAVTVGRHERHGFALAPEWVPLVVGTLAPVPDGWLVTNGTRTTMLVENDWIETGTVFLRPNATAMLQRGEHRVCWPELRSSVSLSLTVRTRRLEDQRVPYAVDAVVDPRAAGVGSYLGVADAPMSGMLRYRLAMLFRHLLEGSEEPRHLLTRRAEQLGITEEELDETVQRFRRRLNAVRGTDLQSLEELGEHLVRSGELSPWDLDP